MTVGIPTPDYFKRRHINELISVERERIEKCKKEVPELYPESVEFYMQEFEVEKWAEQQKQ